MVRLSPELIYPYVTMYISPWNERGEWHSSNAAEIYRFSNEDIGIIMARKKYSQTERRYYLKLITTIGTTGWVFEQHLVSC